MTNWLLSVMKWAPHRHVMWCTVIDTRNNVAVFILGLSIDHVNYEIIQINSFLRLKRLIFHACDNLIFSLWVREVWKIEDGLVICKNSPSISVYFGFGVHRELSAASLWLAAHNHNSAGFVSRINVQYCPASSSVGCRNCMRLKVRLTQD